jgi:hypothetical protein
VDTEGDDGHGDGADESDDGADESDDGADESGGPERAANRRPAPAFAADEGMFGSARMQMRYHKCLLDAGVGEALACDATDLPDDKYLLKCDWLEAGYSYALAALLEAGDSRCRFPDSFPVFLSDAV